MLHDEFIRSSFQRTDLADCTSQYHLFTVIAILQIRELMLSPTIGLTFGLSRENLKALGLTWRGDKLSKDGSDVDDLVNDLIVTYQTRGWSLAAAILKLNFIADARFAALAEVFIAIERSAASRLPLKADEIRFFSRVTERLSVRGLLPLIAVSQGLDAVVRSTELRDDRDTTALRALYHALKDAENLELQELDRGLLELNKLPLDGTLRVAFVFHVEPRVPPRQLFAELQAEELLPSPAPRFIEAVRGSYTEFFLITVQCLASILVALNITERIVDRVIYIRGRTADFALKIAPSCGQASGASTDRGTDAGAYARTQDMARFLVGAQRSRHRARMRANLHRASKGLK